MISLENKVALVTGASRGIGKATAIMLAKLGADIIVHYGRSKDDAQDTANKIEELGRKAYLVKSNISNNNEVKQMFEEVFKKVDNLHILINNAGIVRLNYVRSMKEQEWDEVLDTNLKGAFLCSKYAIKSMMRINEGCIVNVSSIAALKAGITQANYAASKAGLIALTQSMAKELGNFGIRVNAVAPGPIRTDMNVMSEVEEQKVAKLIPLKRIGESEDVANVIAYLCTSMSNYLTGQVIRIDGGLSL